MPVPPGILSQFERALKENRPAQAVAHALRAVALDPGDAIAVDMLRTALFASARYEEALVSARRVNELLPEHAGSWASLGFVLARLSQHAEAAEAFARADALDGATPSYAIERITALIHAGRLVHAEHAARDAISRFGSSAEIVFRLSTSLCEQGRTSEATGVLSEALFDEPANVQLALTQCSIGVYSDSITPDALSAMHRNFGRVLADSVGGQFRGPAGGESGRTMRVELAQAVGRAGPGGLSGLGGRGERGRVRVGIISADFRAHSVAWFARAVLAGLDRERFETLAYSTCAREDSSTELLREATKRAGGIWTRCAGMRAGDLRARLMADRVDLLIDLNGLTEGGCWELLAQRAAPVQCSFLGYPHGTGIANVDVRLVDAWTDPIEPRVDAWHGERLIRLDGCFLCYRLPSAEQLPACERRGRLTHQACEGEIVFGSFNRLAKLSGRCKRVWAKLLHLVPGSRLVIKSGTLADAAAAAMAHEDFRSLGIDSARVEIRAGSPSAFDHLSQYADVDIALDTFPYAGTTTTCEALIMGVPVITLAPAPERGGTHAHRVGLSLLNAVGLEEFAAFDEEAFVRIAAELAANSSRREQLRASLRDRVIASSLCDERAYGVRLSDALARVWNETLARRGATVRSH